jgi:hypothetical protein
VSFATPPYRKLTPALALVLLLAVNFSMPSHAQSNQDPSVSLPIPCETVDEVGYARMSADGAITLHLRALRTDSVAAAELHFAPGDPHYDALKRHLGGIAPGEVKPVPPLCGTNSEP